MSGTKTMYSYRENANPDAFEMDNLRARVYETEKSIGELRARRRIGFTMTMFGILSIVCASAYSYQVKHEGSCKDTIVEAPTHGAGLSCPNPNQRMDEHTIMMPSPRSDVWAVRCLCAR